MWNEWELSGGVIHGVIHIHSGRLTAVLLPTLFISDTFRPDRGFNFPFFGHPRCNRGLCKKDTVGLVSNPLHHPPHAWAGVKGIIIVELEHFELE